MFITFILMSGMAAIAEPMVITLIGEKWIPSIIYLQLLCFVGMFYPLHALNLNMLQVQGRSDLFLRLEIIKKILAVPTILFGVFYGIKILILGMMINTISEYYLNSYWSGKNIGYSFFEQVKDIFPSFLLAVCVSISVFITGNYINLDMHWILGIQIFEGLILTVILAELFKISSYLYIKEIAFEKLRK